MRNLLVIGCLLLLAGCATPTTLISHQHQVVLPSDAMYQCNASATLPDPNTLTDVQVARYLETLYRNNKQCKASLNAIHAFLARSNKLTMYSPAGARKAYTMLVHNGTILKP